VGVDASGAPTIGATASVGGEVRKRVAHASRRVQNLWDPTQAQRTPDREPPHVYSPIFSQGFRVRKRFLGVFGRPELVTLDGDPASGPIARADPTEQLYEQARATVSIEAIQSMSLDDLFEEVTPELVSEEVAAEVGLELVDEEVQFDLTPVALQE